MALFVKQRQPVFSLLTPSYIIISHCKVKVSVMLPFERFAATSSLRSLGEHTESLFFKPPTPNTNKQLATSTLYYDFSGLVALLYLCKINDQRTSLKMAPVCFSV